jgi:hypothetical protein
MEVRPPLWDFIKKKEPSFVLENASILAGKGILKPAP